VTNDVAAPVPKPTLKSRLQTLFAVYGRIAVWTYLSLSVAAIIGFSLAIGLGFEPSSATGVLGAIGAGWVAAKATLPLRVLATLALTPLIAAMSRRLWPQRNRPASDVVSDDGE
jgi:hypothetical protein